MLLLFYSSNVPVDMYLTFTWYSTILPSSLLLLSCQYTLFGQVNENTNGVLGVGSDSSRADGYYHWGALNAMVAIAETGAYPSSML